MNPETLKEIAKQSGSYVKLLMWCALYILVGTLIMLFLYKNKIRQALDEQWHEKKCDPMYMLLAGFSSHVEGNTRMEKFETNFQHCMAKNVNNGFVTLVRPFFTYLNMIKKLIIFVSDKINTYRGAITVLRMMFKAIVKNTIEKLMNTYAAVVYIKEKMKNMMKRQAAIIEIIKQFLTGIPFIIASALYGPIPRFITWLMQWIWLLFIQIVMCILCMKQIPFVSWPACAVCFLCFSPTSLVGKGIFRRRIMDFRPSMNIDDNTKVNGVIYYGKSSSHEFDPSVIASNLTLFYPLYSGNDRSPPTTSIKPEEIFNDRNTYSSTWVTGEHAIYDTESSKWTRVKDWCERRKIRPVISNYPVVSLITSNHTIPVHYGDDEYLCKDYDETGDPYINHTLAFQRQCVRNKWTYTETDIMNYVKKTENIQTYAGMTYESFCDWIHQYDPGYELPKIPTLDAVRNFFYDYRPSKRANNIKMDQIRRNLYGFRMEYYPDIRWYSYKGTVLAENTMVQVDGVWFRIFEVKEARRIAKINSTVTMEPEFLIHIYTGDSMIELGKGCICSDAIEVTDRNWISKEMTILTEIHNQ